MGKLSKVVDGLLLLAFFSILLIVPLDIPDSAVPYDRNPVYKFYTALSQDYLVMERPPFFIALMMLELFYLFPLALLNIYGLLAGKPWFNSTCIIFGSSIIASTTAMLGDIVESGKPSASFMARLYSPFIPLGVLAVVRGMVPISGEAAPIVANGHVSGLKKKA